jgi:hypothetical protein
MSANITNQPPPPPSDATAASSDATVSLGVGNLRFVRDMGLSLSTKRGYSAALSLFNHFLVRVLYLSQLDNISIESLDADAEDILRGYSQWLRDTNIPKNHANARDKQNETSSPTYMSYTGLKEYLDKTIIVLKEILPTNTFLNDDDEIALISGKKFEKGCKRSQMSKSDVFGVESKVGLYRVARHPTIPGYAPHWTSFVNCETICKNMMYKTKNDDVYNDLTGK